MSKKIIKHIQYTDGSYEIVEVLESDVKRLEEIRIHNSEVRKYVYETKKITSKFTVEQVQQMTGQEFECDELDPLEKLIEAEEGNFYEEREFAFEVALELIGQAMSLLTKNQKEVFKAVAEEGKSYRTIAEERAIHFTSVEEIYHAARKKLRKFFLQYPEIADYFPKVKEF